MENVIHHLALDLTGPDMCPMIEVQRGDSARSLIISLTQGGRPYRIDEGLTAALFATKPDGNPLFNACAIEENRIRYDFTPQTANVTGAFDCEIWLVAGDKRELTTPRFTIAVDERMRTDDVIPESAPEYTAITEMVAAGTAMIEELREALAGLEGVEEILTQAREAAEAASNSEAAAKGHAKTAADAAAAAGSIGVGGVKVTDGNAVGVWLQAEGTEREPVLHLYGDHGDEPAVVRNVARAELDRDAVPLGQVKELIAAAGGGGGNGSGQNPPQDGEDGATFTPAVSEDGTLSWSNDKGLENPAPVNIKGPQGERGLTGETGPQGEKGPKGDIGATGPAGADGAKGEKGDTGAQGEPGKDGANGKDGVSATHSWNGTVLTVTSASGTSSADLKGAKGDKGDTGATGPKGDKGDTGAAGKDGVDGLPGTDGIDGADGYTPQIGVDYWTPADKAEIEAYIAAELAKRAQLRPEPAESLDWLRENGNHDLIYVLPNGNLYMWVLTEKEVDNGPTYTNRLPQAVQSGGGEYVGDNGEDGYRAGYRYSASSNAEKEATGYDVTGFIPAVKGDVIRIKNVTQINISNDGSGYCVAYFFTSSYAKTTGAITIRDDATYADGVCSFTVPDYDNIAFFRVTLKGVSADTIITVNEEITEGGGTEIVKEYDWVETGLNITPPNYEPRVIKLEEQVKAHAADIAALQKGVASTTPIKTWDAPIYDANIPVFNLSAEKAAITEAEKTVAGVYAKYDALMARHPQYITRTNLGMCSDGVTPVYRYDFREPEPHRGTTGKKEWSETKAKAIIVSGIHWEWGGIFALYNALEELADNPALFHLRRNTHLIVLPLCNPYAVANMSVRNANLVEIHRNFEVDFIYPGEPGYIELGERSHGGTEPLSEVETQYIDNILKANTDAAFFLTCHSNQSDTVYGTGFTWASPATYYMCNMHYRIVDKLSKVWMEKYGDELAAGIADYRTENTPEWDTRLGSAYLSTTNGTETKQATKYGIQATNIEVTDAFLVHGTKANPEPTLSSFTMSRGAEVYVNFLLTAFGVYDPKDKKEYAPATV